VPLWEIVRDETSVKTLAGRSANSIIKFAQMIQHWSEFQDQKPGSEIIQGILEDSGYVEALKGQGTDEADERVGNVQELYNASLQFAEENSDETLTAFLANTALASDLDDKEDSTSVSLMTLHSAKGLEFPIVFLVGLEQGLFPNFRSLDDAAALEEERRLCYVGITRAKEKLFISHARERRLYGSREVAMPSLFLSELPRDMLQSESLMAIPKPAPAVVAVQTQSPNPHTHAQDWGVGDRLVHKGFGLGEVTHVFGAGNKICLAVKFSGVGQKIIDPKVTKLDRVQ
jgi:DNA helicase-2/ATP-dependent DNA helicase PcrA